MAWGDKGPVNFTDFRMDYHFDKKTGTFSFTPEKDLIRLEIRFPKEFKISSAEFWVGDHRELFGVEYKNMTEKSTSIIFLNKSAGEWIFVNFDMDLSPNSRFSFFKNSIWGGNDNFYFSMGDELECVRQDCFFNLKNAEISRSKLGTQQESSSALKFINQSEGFLSSNDHEFELSARSREALTKKNFYMAVGSSLIVGSIFSFFSIAIAIYQQRKQK